MSTKALTRPMAPAAGITSLIATLTDWLGQIFVRPATEQRDDDVWTAGARGL